MRKITDKKKVKITIVIFLIVLTIVASFGAVYFHFNNKRDNINTYLKSENSKKSIEKDSLITVSDDLQITSIDSYSGVYLEDGSDSVVSEIMMIILRNVSDNDLQLARIKIHYEDFVAEFEATNIPSGESVVLLEKNRHLYVDEEYKNISAENVVFFDEKMNVMEDVFEVIPGDGFFEIRNISSQDVDGKTYIYYKNQTDGTLYGGITYRATVYDSISAGDDVRVLTKHFTENNTKIIQIINVG